MRLTVFEEVAAILFSVVSAGAIGVSGLRWVFRQGGAIQKWLSAIELNTKATQKLSGSFDAFTAKVDGTLTDHEKRITRLEDHERRPGG